jgi:hypothetical protein
MTTEKLRKTWVQPVLQEVRIADTTGSKGGGVESFSGSGSAPPLGTTS